MTRLNPFSIRAAIATELDYNEGKHLSSQSLLHQGSDRDVRLAQSGGAVGLNPFSIRAAIATHVHSTSAGQHGLNPFSIRAAIATRMRGGIGGCGSQSLLHQGSDRDRG